MLYGALKYGYRDRTIDRPIERTGGWQVSEYASKTLIANVQKELAYAFKDPEREQEAPASPKKVAAAIQRAFGRTDRELLAQVAPAFKLGFGAVARCGSCALFTLVHEDFLHVANGATRSISTLIGARR